MNVLILLLATVAFGVAIPYAIRADRADAHLIHTSNCPDCAEDDERPGL